MYPGLLVTEGFIKVHDHQYPENDSTSLNVIREGRQELEHSCGVMPASWAHLRTQWSTALGGLSRFQHAEPIGRPCHYSHGYGWPCAMHKH
jgi:hypothetical protein